MNDEHARTVEARIKRNQVVTGQLRFNPVRLLHFYLPEEFENFDLILIF